MSNKLSLVGDIGGTNARFALIEPGQLTPLVSQNLVTADFDQVELAIQLFLETQGIEEIDRLSLAVAGPVINGQVDMTNTEWVIDRARLQERFGTSVTKVLNDFEAQSLSLPHLSAEHLVAVGGDWQFASPEQGTFGVVGPGSGTGVGGLIKNKSEYHPIVCEGGHTGFAPANAFQLEILHYLLKHFSRVSNERILCGPGMVNLYNAICEIEGATAESLSAAKIGERAMQNSDPLCVKTMEVFFEILGQFAGDLALTINCREGLFIAGGICGRYEKLLQAGNFRRGFENKGRFARLLESIPSWLITHPNPGILGAAASLL